LAGFELRESSARIAVQKAQAKLDLLRKYALPKRVKQLRIAAEKARSKALTTQAKWERERSRLQKLQAVASSRDRVIDDERVAALVNRAISILEELKSKLDLAGKGPEPSEPVRKEISELMAQPESLIGQIRQVEAAVRWAKLKPRILDATHRYSGNGEEKATRLDSTTNIPQP
jgi:hypothetical protein